jgi:hypothetical protein
MRKIVGSPITARVVTEIAAPEVAPATPKVGWWRRRHVQLPE